MLNNKEVAVSGVREVGEVADQRREVRGSPGESGVVLRD